MQDELERLQRNHAAVMAAMHRLRGGLRLMRYVAVPQWAKDRLDALAQDSEPLRLALKARGERDRLLGELESERTTALKAATGTQLHEVGAVLYRLRDDHTRFVQSCRQDCTRSLPGTLDGVDKTALLLLAAERRQRRAELADLPPGDLFREYNAALRHPANPASLATVEAVESLLAQQRIHASDDVQRQDLQRLHDWVDDCQASRVPDGTPDVPGLVRRCEIYAERARILNVVPVDARQPTQDSEAAAAALATLGDELDLAGAPSDADEFEQRRQAAREDAVA